MDILKLVGLKKEKTPTAQIIAKLNEKNRGSMFGGEGFGGTPAAPPKGRTEEVVQVTTGVKITFFKEE